MVNRILLIVLFRWAAVIFDPPVRVSYVYLLASDNQYTSDDVYVYSRTENENPVKYYEGATC